MWYYRIHTYKVSLTVYNPCPNVVIISLVRIGTQIPSSIHYQSPINLCVLSL